MVYKIVSGGQTGVDRAALDMAIENEIACGGWCPKGRMAEDGPLDAKYPLIETPAPSPSQRTEWNVRDSEATLIIVWGSPQGGTLKTAAAAARLKKPFLLINMLEKPAVEAVQKWIEKTQAHVVNIAGPRASEVPEAYEEAKLFLTEVFASEDDDDDETGLLPE